VQGFWWDAWTSFKAVSGPVLAGAALVLALLGPLYAPAAIVQISLIWVAVAGLITSIVLLTALNLTVSARQAARSRLPRARYAIVAGRPDEGPLTLVLDRSELFGVNLVVTIYYTDRAEPGDDDAVIERLIGVGRVSNVQQNGLIQVLVLVEVPSHAGLWQRIRNREASTIAQIVVKPSIPYDEAGMEVRFNG